MVYGGSLIILAAAAESCIKNNSFLIKCYMFCMIIIFVVGLGVIVAGIMSKDTLIDIAMTKIPRRNREKMRSLLNDNR